MSRGSTCLEASNQRTTDAALLRLLRHNHPLREVFVFASTIFLVVVAIVAYIVFIAAATTFFARTFLCKEGVNEECCKIWRKSLRATAEGFQKIHKALH